MRHAPRFRVLALVLCAIMISACASRQPLPQPRKVADPDTVPGSVKTADYGIAAVGYAYFGEGMDYRKAGLEPVFLVFKNSSDKSYVVEYSQLRGIGPQGEFLPYSIDEATELVTRSEAFSVTAGDAARTGALGAVLGAGIGALLGTIGGVAGGWGSESETRRTVLRELSSYAWTSEPVPPSYTKVGYVYFPGGVGIERVTLLVAHEGVVTPYTLPVAHVFDEKAEARCAQRVPCAPATHGGGKSIWRTEGLAARTVETPPHFHVCSSWTTST